MRKYLISFQTVQGAFRRQFLTLDDVPTEADIEDFEARMGEQYHDREFSRLATSMARPPLPVTVLAVSEIAPDPSPEAVR